MFVNRRDVQIQWGDCDPANIVYYPRYFEMFDDSTSIMFEAAGFSKQDIIRKYGLVGIPMDHKGMPGHIRVCLVVKFIIYYFQSNNIMVCIVNEATRHLMR